MEDVDPDVGDGVTLGPGDPFSGPAKRRCRTTKTPQTFVMDCVSLDVAPTVHFTDKGFEVECVDGNNVARICLSFYQAEALRTRLGKALGIGE